MDGAFRLSSYFVANKAMALSIVVELSPETIMPKKLSRTEIAVLALIKAGVTQHDVKMRIATNPKRWQQFEPYLAKFTSERRS